MLKIRCQLINCDFNNGGMCNNEEFGRLCLSLPVDGMEEIE